MPNRRDLLRLATLAPAAALLGGCGQADYERAVRETWRVEPVAPDEPVALLRELVRCATLAANSHNTQPWRFALAADEIAIRPDPSRRTPVVDPDDHHLWASLGCAAENLAVAAAAFGRRAEVGFDPAGAVRVRLDAMAPVRSPLYAAIAQRQSTRAEFDGQPLATAELRALESTASGAGVRVLLLTERRRIDAVADFVTAGNSAQMRDAAFVRELKQWIRFSDAEALASRDGLFARASGNPAAPRWLGSLMFDLLFHERAENEKYARQLRSSAGVAVFVAEAEDAAHWVEAGRACQRFALLATSLGVRTAFVNQPVEVPALRAQFGRWLGVDARADLVVRFGRGPLLPASLRRPVDSVVVGAAALRAARGAVSPATPA
jgi:nitroreductase